MNRQLVIGPRQQHIDDSHCRRLYRIDAALVRESLIPPRVRMLGSNWKKSKALKIRNTKTLF